MNYYRNKQDPFLIKFDFINDLEKLLEKHWNSVLAYKALLETNTITDVCNTLLYKNMNVALNSICLILFIDGSRLPRRVMVQFGLL